MIHVVSEYLTAKTISFISAESYSLINTDYTKAVKTTAGAKKEKAIEFK